MYDFNNMIDLMRSGVSAQDLAKAFTDNLNNAIEVVEAEKITEDDYKMACAEVANAFNDAVQDYVIIHKLDIDEKDLVIDQKFVNDVIEFFVELLPYVKSFSKVINLDGKKKENEATTDSFEDVMAKFFREAGI